MTLGTQTQPYGKLLDYEQFIDHQLALVKALELFASTLAGGAIGEGCVEFHLEGGPSAEVASSGDGPVDEGVRPRHGRSFAHVCEDEQDPILVVVDSLTQQVN